jgi:predicted HTH transcriptional regulator
MKNPVQSSMTIPDFIRLVKTGEGSYLEFKRTISSPEKVAREISAFANTRGGILLIGVNDNKSVVGVESFYEEEMALEKALDYYCVPPVDADIEILPYYERELIIVRIPEAERKPVAVDADGKRTVYIRDKDKSVQASKEVAAVLRNSTSTSGIKFEYGPNEQRLFRYLGEYDRITVIEFANLVNISQRRASRVLTNLVSAGVLRLFTHEKQEFFTHA